MLTAVGILQLAEKGYLGLEDEVFGKEGILNNYKPVEGVPFDPRIKDITVDHLLRHAAGWDETKGPIYDPMMNQMYIAKGKVYICPLDLCTLGKSVFCVSCVNSVLKS